MRTNDKRQTMKSAWSTLPTTLPTLLSTLLPALLLCLLASACSLTKNLPEGEKLYRGIKGIDYDKRQLTTDKGQETGVITALADAYTTVEGLLSGDASALKPAAEEMDEKALRDSLRRITQKDKEAFESARSEVDAVLSYAPNGALMGSSFVTHPFPIKLLIYNRYAGSKHRFGQWMFNNFAGSPVLMSNVNPYMRSKVAQNTLRSRGFFRASTSYELLPQRDTLKQRVRYRVHPGPLYHLDSIAYQMFPPGADSILRSTADASLLHRGDPFSVVTLEAERKRIADALREQGYYYQRNDYITYRADTLQTPLMAKVQVRPSLTAPREAMHPYYIGNIRVNIYKYGDRRIVDSLVTRQGMSFGYSQPLPQKWKESAAPPKGGRGVLLRPRALWRSLLFRRGDLYRQSTGEMMQEELAQTGIFSSLRINYVARGTTDNGQRTTDNDTLDIVINATLDKPYDAEFQGNVTTKTGGQVGPGASFSFSKRNAFRSAETLTLKVWGSYEWQTGANTSGNSSLLNSYEYGLSGSLSYPRFRFFGIGLGRRLARRFVSTTSLDLQARWMNRAGYFGRVSWSAGVGYTLQRGQRIKHEFSPLTITYDQLLNSTARFDSIVQANQALYVSMRDQFVPSMSYTFSWAGTSERPSALTVSVKEASAIVSSIYAIAGEPYSKEGKKLLGVPFAQFIKSTVQYTRQFPLTMHSLLAMRLYGGFVYSYGNAVSAPYSELFSVGGANSIRAFGMRSIGPGSYHPASSQYSYIDQMGDLKLEANLEYRFPIIGKLQGAAFIDAGNVWLLRESPNQPGGKFSFRNFADQIALGTGAGLRYDLDFLVIRFDLGIGIHAPYDTGRSGYYNMPSFGRSLGYHFAIGYPF